MNVFIGCHFLFWTLISVIICHCLFQNKATCKLCVLNCGWPLIGVGTICKANDKYASPFLEFLFSLLFAYNVWLQHTATLRRRCKHLQWRSHESWSCRKLMLKMTMMMMTPWITRQQREMIRYNLVLEIILDEICLLLNCFCY